MLRSDKRGIVAVEFVLMFPVMFGIFLMAFDISQLQYQRINLVGAVTVAAINAVSLPSSEPTTIIDSGIVINIVPSGQTITVTGTFTYNWIAIPLTPRVLTKVVTVTIPQTGGGSGSGSGQHAEVTP